MTKTYSGSEFADALVAGTLKKPIVAVGMAKPGEQERETIQFASGTDCSVWTTIPVALIESVDSLGDVRCKDHEHPLVAIELADPQGDEAAVFADLLRNAAPEKPAPRGAGSVEDVAAMRLVGSGPPGADPERCHWDTCKTYSSKDGWGSAPCYHCPPNPPIVLLG